MQKLSKTQIFIILCSKSILMTTIEDFKSYSEKQKDAFLTHLKEALKSKYIKRNPEKIWKDFTKGVRSYTSITEDIYFYLKTKASTCSGSKKEENYFIKDEQDTTVLSASQIRDLLGNKKPIKATAFELLLAYAEIDDVEWGIKKDAESPVKSPDSRQTFLKRLGLGLGIFGLLIAAGTGTYFYKEKQFQTLKLWSTILDINDIADDEGLKELYKELMEPIDDLIGDKKKGIGKIKSLIFALEREESPSDKLPTYLDTLPDEIKGPTTVTYGDKQILTFDFSNGVSAYYPMDEHGRQPGDSVLHKRESIRVFSPFNGALTAGHNRYTTLEEGLGEKLGIDNNGRAGIKPVLIYSLFFPAGNKEDGYKDAYMYRYPQYIKKDKATYLKPYENYRPYKRTFFHDFIHSDNALRIATKEGTIGHNVWLSSIYSDYNKKTIDPLRSLMIELNGRGDRKDGLFLLCVDFKYIR